MLLPIKCICPRSKVRLDGTGIIFIQYCYSATKRTLLNTEISIPIEYWNPKQCRVSDRLPSEFGNYEQLNEELHRQVRIAEDLVTYAAKRALPDKGAFVKKSFSPKLDTSGIVGEVDKAVEQVVEERRSKQDIYYQFDDYIKSKERKVSKATLTVYNNVKSHLLGFEAYRKQKIGFNSFDFSFYIDFIDYLTFEHVHLRRQTVQTGLRLNTIGKTIKHLRGFIKDRVKRKIIAPIELSDFRIPEEESDAIYLTHDEIAKIYQTDLSEHPHLVEYRDLFVLACLTGLRFSDFFDVAPGRFTAGYALQKTGEIRPLGDHTAKA
jgi:hypothetical protein